MLESEMLLAPGGYGQFRDNEGIPNGGIPHRWLGDNAWLLIALNNYHQLSGNSDKYQEMAAALDEWIRSLQTDDAKGWLIPSIPEEDKFWK